MGFEYFCFNISYIHLQQCYFTAFGYPLCVLVYATFGNTSDFGLGGGPNAKFVDENAPCMAGYTYLGINCAKIPSPLVAKTFAEAQTECGEVDMVYFPELQVQNLIFRAAAEHLVKYIFRSLAVVDYSALSEGSHKMANCYSRALGWVNVLLRHMAWNETNLRPMDVRKRRDPLRKSIRLGSKRAFCSGRRLRSG